MLRPSVFYLILRRYGRRPGQPSSSSLARRACVHFDFVFWVFLNYGCAPGPFGDRGDTPRWGLMAGTAACCTPYIRCCPFSFPVQSQSTKLPATTEGRWRRRHLSPGHKAGLLTVLLTCTGCAFQVTPGVEKGVTLKRTTNPRTGGYHPKNWTHVSKSRFSRQPQQFPFNLVYGVHVLFGTFMCLLCLSTQALTAGHNQSPLRLDKPYEFSRTPRSASATEGCQEDPRESRGDRVMSHDKRTCPEASTWHVQLFLSCWSSRSFLSSGLRCLHGIVLPFGGSP